MQPMGTKRSGSRGSFVSTVTNALDVFYVTGREGGPLGAAESSRVEAALMAALDPRLADGVAKEKG